MYLVKTPKLVQTVFDSFLWKIETETPTVYLTFDDGPIPKLTPWVLDLLDQYDAKATFFCVGDNVKKHPTIYHDILKRGHNVGNHTFNHLNGWKSDHYTYVKNVLKCKQYIDTNIFRPPYGKLKPKQAAYIQKLFKIVMWDVLSGDFDTKITPEQCLDNVLKNIQKNSIIVFHDNIKAEKNLKYTLPLTLDFIKKQGWKADSIQINRPVSYAI
jgi:peptidoglycan-N-acetylglucosamine deacetylase